MKIIYFTTSQDEKDYRSFMKIWKIPLNSSNQNFHNKFIRSLSIKNTIDVISVRPFSRSKTRQKKLLAENKTDGNINWHYLKRGGGRIMRTISITPQVKKIFRSLDTKDSIIITDTINPSVVRSVEQINKKYKLPVLGVCTDSPSNISGTKRSYTLYLLSKTNNYSGYICLTEGLKNLFNPNNRPSYVFEGLVEEREFAKFDENVKPYFFFGGALMQRYGIYNLIDAFKELNNSSIDLYICGHHGDKAKIKDEIKGNNNIKFLGLLPMNKVLEYEYNAIASINPRPFSEDLDRFSIPSKTLEYMSMGRPVISVRNTILMEKFPNDVIWAQSSNKENLIKAMKAVLSMTEVERENMGEETKNRVLKLYSLQSISDNIQNFLLQFVEKNLVN